MCSMTSTQGVSRKGLFSPVPTTATTLATPLASSLGAVAGLVLVEAAEGGALMVPRLQHSPLPGEEVWKGVWDEVWEGGKDLLKAFNDETTGDAGKQSTKGAPEASVPRKLLDSATCRGMGACGKSDAAPLPPSTWQSRPKRSSRSIAAGETCELMKPSELVPGKGACLSLAVRNSLLLR